ncbi:hypothetical protein LG299_02150 [Microbacterium lacus]|uniref:hypothetical protein n=1 Tax=Microbacterium lacus TaxID=415217 RepID=UPI00384DB089
MSTPEQPEASQLTRKQMREIRNTGLTPVITADTVDQTAAAPVTPAPLARAAEPVVVSPPPAADATVDLGVSPLTRRQARQQERIRTASVPVITPDMAAAHTAAVAAIAPTLEDPLERPQTDESEDLLDEIVVEHDEVGDDDVASEEVALLTDAETASDEADEDEASDSRGDDDDDADADADADESSASEEDDDADRAVVSPLFGAGVIAGEPSRLDLPPSFDQLLARSSTGSVGTTNALILSHTGDAPIVGPVTATGEILITGTLNLPEGLGSTGHAPGTADGKDVDAVLIDGELPAHSSPTPIAASAAISTVKSAGDVIRPPAPEKGSRLMMTLAITAGALALALVGVLIVAISTGVFS